MTDSAKIETHSSALCQASDQILAIEQHTRQL